MQIIAWFSDITKNDNQIVGGKGCNLGVMYNIKLPVPPGFVVTTQAYKYFVENTGIQNKILNVVKDLDVEDTEKLQKASNEIQEIILDAQMPREIKTAVIGSYEDLNVDRAVSKVISNNPLTSLIKTGRELPFVAVRSSANAEDQESISENDFVFVKLNDKPFFGRMKEDFCSDFMSCLVKHTNLWASDATIVADSVSISKKIPFITGLSSSSAVA